MVDDLFSIQTRLGGKPAVGFRTSVREWSFPSKLTLASTHAVHPYVASMNPHLARALIKTVNPQKNGKILDPFVGGGAVLVEALRNGYPAQGIDVNPLGVLISKVKTTYVPQDALWKSYGAILEGYLRARADSLSFPAESRIDYWFRKDSIEVLTKLASTISQIEEENVRDVFKVILSGTVRDVSLTYRGEIRLRRLQGDDLAQFKPDVIKKFAQRSKLTISRVSSLPESPIIDVSLGNATNMEFESDLFSAIVCSPPYGDDRNGVGYFQFSKNMLYWLGYSSEEIAQHKKQFLGAVKSNKKAPDSPTLNSAIESIIQQPVKSNPKAVEECIAFYSDLFVALREMTRVCSGRIAIVIGNRTLSKTLIDNGQIIIELMQNLDYKLLESRSRIINKKRIAVMQPGGGARDVSGGGLINAERTLIFGS
jgi:tRNA G10  N-methylase Trm11